MSDNNPQTQNLTTLSRTEAMTLAIFINQVDNWLAQHGEKAQNIEIIYDPEDEGFEVTNGEPNNGVLKKNRATAFRTEMLAWGFNQIKSLLGWQGDKEVKAFTCVYKNNEFGVSVEVGEKQTTAESPVADE